MVELLVEVGPYRVASPEAGTCRADRSAAGRRRIQATFDPSVEEDPWYDRKDEVGSRVEAYHPAAAEAEEVAAVPGRGGVATALGAGL